MRLGALPRFGATDNPRLTYKIHESEWVGHLTIVLGQATVAGRLSDWFVQAYDEHGVMVGTGVTTASYPAAREWFDGMVAGRRRRSA